MRQTLIPSVLLEKTTIHLKERTYELLLNWKRFLKNISQQTSFILPRSLTSIIQSKVANCLSKQTFSARKFFWNNRASMESNVFTISQLMKCMAHWGLIHALLWKVMFLCRTAPTAHQKLAARRWYAPITKRM